MVLHVDKPSSTGRLVFQLKMLVYMSILQCLSRRHPDLSLYATDSARATGLLSRQIRMALQAIASPSAA